MNYIEIIRKHKRCQFMTMMVKKMELNFVLMIFLLTVHVLLITFQIYITLKKEENETLYEYFMKYIKF